MCNLNKYSSGKLIDTKQLKNCNWRIITVPSSVVIVFICYITEPQPDRSSHQRCFVRKSVLRNFAKFTGKHLCQGLFFNKHLRPQPATLLKKRLWHSCFLVNFAKFLRTSFLQKTSGRLFLKRSPISITAFYHLVIDQKVIENLVTRLVPQFRSSGKVELSIFHF